MNYLFILVGVAGRTDKCDQNAHVAENLTSAIYLSEKSGMSASFVWKEHDKNKTTTKKKQGRSCQEDIL